MKTLALVLLLSMQMLAQLFTPSSTPAFADEPASRRTPNKVYGIYVDDTDGNALAIPILGIIFGFPSIVGIVALALVHQRKKAREATLRLAIQTPNVPPELLAALTNETKPKQTEAARALPQAVLLGCILAGVGCIADLQHYGVMLFFMFMGAGLVLRAFLTQRT